MVDVALPSGSLISVAEDGSASYREPPGWAGRAGNAPCVEEQALQMSGLGIVVLPHHPQAIILCHLVLLRLRLIAVSFQAPANEILDNQSKV